MSGIQTVQTHGRFMDEEEPKVLVPVLTANILLRDIPYSVKQRLWIVRREMGWNSWADMAMWVHENSQKITPFEMEWPNDELGFLVCRNLPIEIKDDLARIKRIHGWSKWTSMVEFVLRELE